MKAAPLPERFTKTFRRWRYHRTPAGSYQWIGPHGQHFLVTPTGTIPIPPN